MSSSSSTSTAAAGAGAASVSREQLLLYVKKQKEVIRNLQQENKGEGVPPCVIVAAGGSNCGRAEVPPTCTAVCDVSHCGVYVCVHLCGLVHNRVLNGEERVRVCVWRTNRAAFVFGRFCLVCCAVGAAIKEAYKDAESAASISDKGGSFGC